MVNVFVSSENEDFQNGKCEANAIIRHSNLTYDVMQRISLPL